MRDKWHRGSAWFYMLETAAPQVLASLYNAIERLPAIDLNANIQDIEDIVRHREVVARRNVETRGRASDAGFMDAFNAAYHGLAREGQPAPVWLSAGEEARIRSKLPPPREDPSASRLQ